MSVPFVDLKSQFQRIQLQIEGRINTVLKHGKYIQGPEVAELEHKLAEFCGVRHAVGVSSGSDALLVALLAENIGPGDAVFLPAFTFTATAEVILLAGATPVFVDVDSNNYNISIPSLEMAIAHVETLPGLTAKAIMPVDLFGLPANYFSINSIAQIHNLVVISDAAQSFGAQVDNQKVGMLAKITATSFFPAKPLGCYGDGGAIFTDSDSLDEIFRSIRAHGKGSEKYDIVRIGLNARLDTLQAAILLEKLAIFDDELAARRAVARKYDEVFLENEIPIPPRPKNSLSAWAQYTISIANREVVQSALIEKGVPTAIYYPLPMHKQTAYRKYLSPEIPLSNSENLSATVLSLPMHPYLSMEQAEYVATTVAGTIDEHR
jgi:UDP-2-acetamido-2-deoxy-ribo-hexuluronate aminotransferase